MKTRFLPRCPTLYLSATLIPGVLASIGCGPRTDDGSATSSSALPRPTPTTDPVSASAKDAADDELSTRPVELLKFQLTRGVTNKEPVDVLEAASPGQKVYAHLTLRNRTGRKRTVHLEFEVNGETRTEMDLKVDPSWSWRTWGYNTVLPTDKPGTLKVSVTDDEGHPLVEETIPIGPAAR